MKIKKEALFFNGKFIPQDQARISALSPGLLYGWGLFETMRSLGGRVVYLNEHLKRMKRSCALLRINLGYPPEKLRKAVREIVKINGLKDAYVRLSVWKGVDKKVDVLIIARKYKPLADTKYKQGFSCAVSNLRQNENSLLSRAKTTNYLFCQLAYLEAQDKGFDEAIIMNNAGYLAEAARANLFLVKNNELFTPALECGCLDGITRRAVLDLAKKRKIKAREGNFSLQNLYEADEAFLTNSLMGIMPVKSAEHIRIGKGREVTGLLGKEYNLLLKNGS